VSSKTLDKTIRFFSAAYIDCAMTAGPETGPIAAALSGSRALQSFREACVAECADCLRTLSPCVLKGVQGRSGTAIIGAADALSTAAGNGVLARNVAEDTLSGAIWGAGDLRE
jgi:hypothetical protein